MSQKEKMSSPIAYPRKISSTITSICLLCCFPQEGFCLMTGEIKIENAAPDSDTGDIIKQDDERQ